MRPLPFAAFGVSLVMAGLAVWQISESPGAIPEVQRRTPADERPGEPVEVTVDAGLSPQDIGERLEEAGVIDSATQFRVLVALLGYERMLQAGEYEFDPDTPALAAVYRMRRGMLSVHSVTVVEGWRLEEIADAVAAQGVSREKFLAAARARDYAFGFLSGLGRGQSLEGYLYPATYPIRRRDTARDVVEKMLKTLDENVPGKASERAQDLGLSLNDVLVLASIIEREAQVASERPVMAQVFLSRLRRGILLEADPTVQYALAADPENVERYGYWKRELTRADLETDSPYNTYRRSGLPPGPICNPGLESILAVVEPADTNYLYFVAKPDGSHAFAETLQEHQENVRRYRGQ